MSTNKSKELLNWYMVKGLKKAINEIKKLDSDTSKWNRYDWATLSLAYTEIGRGLAAEHMTCLVDMDDEK